MNNKKIIERLDLIEEAINDYKTDKLSPLAAITAIGMIAVPGDINEAEREWAMNLFSKEKP